MMVLTAIRHINVNNLSNPSEGIFDLICNESDFRIAMQICETLLYHAVYIYRELEGMQEPGCQLPIESGVAARRNALYNSLPDSFSKKDYDAQVKALKETESIAAKWIDGFIKAGKLKRVGQGEYSKVLSAQATQQYESR